MSVEYPKNEMRAAYEAVVKEAGLEIDNMGHTVKDYQLQVMSPTSLCWFGAFWALEFFSFFLWEFWGGDAEGMGAGRLKNLVRLCDAPVQVSDALVLVRDAPVQVRDAPDRVRDAPDRVLRFLSRHCRGTTVGSYRAQKT